MISCPPPLTHGIERNCISQAACAQNVQTDHSVGRSHSIRLIGVSAHARLTCFHGFMLPCSLFRCWGEAWRGVRDGEQMGRRQKPTLPNFYSTVMRLLHRPLQLQKPATGLKAKLSLTCLCGLLSLLALACSVDWVSGRPASQTGWKRRDFNKFSYLIDSKVTY